MAMCSYCLKDKLTVDRNSFDGMCVECTNKALNNDSVLKQAELNNKLLKPKY